MHSHLLVSCSCTHTLKLHLALHVPELFLSCDAKMSLSEHAEDVLVYKNPKFKLGYFYFYFILFLWEMRMEKHIQKMQIFLILTLKHLRAENKLK